MKGCSCSHPLGVSAPTHTLDAQVPTAYGTLRPCTMVGTRRVDSATVKSYTIPHQHGINLPGQSAPYAESHGQHRPQSSLAELKEPSQATYTRIPLSSSSRGRAPTEVFKLAFDNNRVLCPYLYETYGYALNDMANRKIETLTRGLAPVSIPFDQQRPTGSYAPVRVRYQS